MGHTRVLENGIWRDGTPADLADFFAAAKKRATDRQEPPEGQTLAAIAEAPLAREAFEWRLAEVVTLFADWRAANRAAQQSLIAAAVGYNRLYKEVQQDGQRVRELNDRLHTDQRTGTRLNTIARKADRLGVIPPDRLPVAFESMYELALALTENEAVVVKAFRSDLFEPTRENIRKLRKTTTADDEEESEEEEDATARKSPSPLSLKSVLAKFVHRLKEPLDAASFANSVKSLGAQVRATDVKVVTNQDGTFLVRGQFTFTVGATDGRDAGAPAATVTASAV